MCDHDAVITPVVFTNGLYIKFYTILPYRYLPHYGRHARIAVMFFLSYSSIGCWWLVLWWVSRSGGDGVQGGYIKKHRKNREKLPWEYLICCRGVKLFLLKYVTITTVPTATVATVTITTVTNITTVTVTTVTITTVTIN